MLHAGGKKCEFTVKCLRQSRVRLYFGVKSIPKSMESAGVPLLRKVLSSDGVTNETTQNAEDEIAIAVPHGRRCPSARSSRRYIVAAAIIGTSPWTSISVHIRIFQVRISRLSLADGLARQFLQTEQKNVFLFVYTLTANVYYPYRGWGKVGNFHIFPTLDQRRIFVTKSLSSSPRT